VHDLQICRDEARERRIKEFFLQIQTGVVTDAMVLLGLEGWMDGIFPMKPDRRLFGRAFTINLAPVRCGDEANYSFYDLAGKWNAGDIIVVGGDPSDCSLMGENVAHVCMYAGAGGAVLNGRCRDFAEISQLEMPVFCKGPTMRLRTKYQKFVAYNVPVNCAGAQVLPGDYVFGDVDGLLVFPADRVDDIMYQAERLLEIEKDLEEAIKNRRPMSEVKEIIRRKKQPRPR
jgi:4-hydroxy-4-methyl-2-oxoglutarate aldolase